MNRPLFGAMGGQNTSEYRPPGTHTNGRIDFGSYGEVGNAWINLLGKEIRKGEICTYRDSPNEVDLVTTSSLSPRVGPRIPASVEYVSESA